MLPTLRRPWTVVVTVLVALMLTLLVAPPPAYAAGMVTVVVQGRGDVTGEGISCSETGGSDCSEFYPNEPEECIGEPPHQTCFTPPPVRELTAGPDRSGYAFSSFQNCSEVSGRTCTVSVTSSRTVTAVFVDVAPPTVGLSAPSGAVRGSVLMSATAADNSSVNRVEFRVRGALVGTDTSSPYQATWNSALVADGFAAVSATAVDQSGLTAVSSGSFTIDNTAPVLGVTGPDGATFGPGSTQTWTLGATDATSGVAGLSCAVAPASTTPTLGPCSGGTAHQATGLAGGSYVFTARAVDAAGNETTATRAFSIDASPPTSAIVSGPASGSVTSSRTAMFAMTASEAGATFACRTYPFGTTPPAFGACTGATQHVLTGLADGGHTFEVRATDAVGNVETAPVVRAFTVDGTPPETSFTKTPKSVIRSKKRKVVVRFVLAASEVGTFQCSLDGKAYAACSPETTFKVRRGAHTLRVIATDTIGNADPTPASYSWKVKKKR